MKLTEEHEKALESDFNAYIEDFKNKFNDSLDSSEKNFFESVYPLFVLLKSLTHPHYHTNPNAEIQLQKAFEQGDYELVRKLGRNLVLQLDKNQENQLLQEGISERVIHTPYYKELSSDNLMLLNAYYTNNYRGAYIALRTILEDLCRHLYYKDHLQEFIAIQQHEKYDEHTDFSLGFKPINDYLRKTTFLNILSGYNKKFDAERKNNIFSWNIELYGKTSAYVHASKIEFMSGYTSNSSMSFDDDESKKIITTTKDVITLAIIFLICAHRPLFLRFSDYSKSLILKTFCKPTRIKFRKAINV